MSFQTDPSGAFVGRDTLVEYALVDIGGTPSEGDWKILGCTRGKSFDLAWGEATTTSSCSPDNHATALATFKDETFSIDGVSSIDAAANQEDLYDHVRGASQPLGWIRLSRPNDTSQYRQTTAPALFTAFNYADPHDGEATWTLNGRILGKGTVENVAADNGNNNND